MGLIPIHVYKEVPWVHTEPIRPIRLHGFGGRIVRLSQAVENSSRSDLQLREVRVASHREVTLPWREYRSTFVSFLKQGEAILSAWKFPTRLDFHDFMRNNAASIELACSIARSTLLVLFPAQEPTILNPRVE